MLLISKVRMCCGWCETDTFCIARQCLQPALSVRHTLWAPRPCLPCRGHPGNASQVLDACCATLSFLWNPWWDFGWTGNLGCESCLHCPDAIKLILHRQSSYGFQLVGKKDWYWGSSCISQVCLGILERREGLPGCIPPRLNTSP